MKRLALLLLLAAGMLVASACGGPVPALDAPAQPQPTAQPAETVLNPTGPAVTEQGPAQAPPVESATKVVITLADNTITSSLTAFKAGVPYTFSITNRGRHEHNFNISPPVAVAGSIENSLASALLTVGDDQLPIGGGTTVEYTFPESAVGTVLEFNCLIRRHYEDGMRLDITVSN